MARTWPSLFVSFHVLCSASTAANQNGKLGGQQIDHSPNLSPRYMLWCIRARVHTRYMRPYPQNNIVFTPKTGKERKEKGREGKRMTSRMREACHKGPSRVEKRLPCVKSSRRRLKEAMTWLDTKVAEALLCLLEVPGLTGAERYSSWCQALFRMDVFWDIRQTVGCNVPSSIMYVGAWQCLAPLITLFAPNPWISLWPSCVCFSTPVFMELHVFWWTPFWL